MATILGSPTGAVGRQLPAAPRAAIKPRSGMFRRGEAEQHRAELLEAAGPEADWPKPTGWNLLVIQWMPPTKTAGGIDRPPVSEIEDKWQGNVGLVLALGPDAYKEDHMRKFPHGAWCQAGDFILFAATALEGKRFRWRGGRNDIFILPDDRVEAVIPDPVDAV